MELVVVRQGAPADLAAISAIQIASPEAAQWPVADYLAYEFAVAEWDGKPAGFAVWRAVGEGEFELLNLAVDLPIRRRGVGAALIAALPSGRVFIEVRESNTGARAFYLRYGFTLIGVRKKYYRSPTEDGIVMERQK